MKWIRVTPCENIPPREGRAVSVAGREIAIFNLGPSTPSTELGAGEIGAGDRFLAVDNQCPHKAGPLADGIVTGMSVVCPLHTWKISLEDGRVQRPSGSADLGVTAYPARVEAGVVVVGVPEVADGANNLGQKVQDCLSEESLLQERMADPPCPHADACVSSNLGNPGI
jgi:nitrite reductase [NAD(P)H] small subunit